VVTSYNCSSCTSVSVVERSATLVVHDRGILNDIIFCAGTAAVCSVITRYNKELDKMSFVSLYAANKFDHLLQKKKLSSVC